MKHLHFLSLLLAPLMLIGENVDQKTSSKQKPIQNKDNNSLISLLTVGGNYSRLNFKPDGQPSFNGNMGGAHAKYEYRPANAFYGGIEFDWRRGSMDGSAGKRTLTDINVAEKMGYTWLCDRWLFTLYTGFGFRYLGHHLQPSSSFSTLSGPFSPAISGGSSLKFDYYEFYFPVGFVSEYKFNSCFTLGLDFEWMPQAFPTVQIRPLGGTFWSLTNKFANFLVEMPFIFTLTKRGNWMITLNPFYERWQDGHSTAKTSRGIPLGLPGNTYNFYGANLNLVYSF